MMKQDKFTDVYCMQLWGRIPSKYQKNFFYHLTETTNNMVVNAVAGSGKTTTMEMGADLIPKGEPAIFLAFNRDIVNELKERIKKPNIHISTLHSFGCRMLMTHYGGLKIDENKAYTAALKLFDKYAHGTKENKQTYAYRVSRLVDMARLTLTDVYDEEAMLLLSVKYEIEAFENEIAGAQMVLEHCNSQAHERIDFTDMVYLPVLKNLKLRKYKYVFLDEAQDLNKVQQEMVSRIIHPKGGRLICVGDPMQSIYGFAGADTHSFQRMKTLLPNTVEIPLSICYRCPKQVVELAKTIVPYIEHNPNRDDHDVPVMDGSYKDIRQGDWVLCRNTKPLVLLFIMLISEGKNAYIKGREIGANLINLIKRTKATTLQQLLDKLNADRVALKVKLIKKRIYRPETSEQMVAFNEKCNVIKLLSRHSTSVPDLIKRIENIFLDKKEGAITLSTIHKSKGAEANRVHVIARELMPSKYAKTEEQLLQEENLRYVCITRAKKQLFWVTDFNIEEIEQGLKDILL